MSLSTSSSNPGEWRVILFLAASFLSAEVIVRQFEPLLSRDLAHIRTLPQTAEALRSHAGAKILVLGNSLTRWALDTHILTQGLSTGKRQNPALFWCVPDGTNMTNWDYCLHRYFLHTGAIPDELFIGTGPLHLRDSPGDASRLAAYHVDSQDFQRAWTQDLGSWEERCEFLLSRISMIHASRHRIKPHVFGTLVPHYFEVEQWINNQGNASQRRLGGGDPTKDSYHHLDHLLAACHQHGIKVRLFSIPLPEPYTVPTTVVSRIERAGGSWLPLATTTIFSPTSFPDGYHLGAEGAKKFTTRLVEALHGE